MMKRTDSWSIIALGALLLGLCVSAPAAAQADRAVDAIEPIVDRASFDKFLRQIGMDRDQQLIAEMLFTDYLAQIDELAARTDVRAKAAGRQRAHDALIGDVYVEPQELRRLRVAVLEVYRASWTEADAYFSGLTASAHSLLTTDQRADNGDALRDLRREVWLRPRAHRGSDETYAGDGVDVVELTTFALRPDGELADLAEADIAGILGTYRQQMDTLLLATAAAERAGRMDLAIARIERDRTRQEREREAALQCWLSLYQLNQQTVRAIGEVAQQRLGVRAQQRWQQRFDEACFPWLFSRSMPEKQFEWIKRYPLDSSVHARATTIIGEYRTRRVEVNKQAISIVLRGRLTHRVILHSTMNPMDIDDSDARGLYQELLRHSGRRKAVEREVGDKLEALLTEGQRGQMRADIAASAYGHRR